jgi:hypothetical protein
MTIHVIALSFNNYLRALKLDLNQLLEIRISEVHSVDLVYKVSVLLKSIIIYNLKLIPRVTSLSCFLRLNL